MICAIVLAAGRSTRMGTQKLLLPFAGKTVIGHIVDQLALTKAERIIVVVGADADQIAAALGGRRVTLVSNPDPRAEMISSVRCGFAALPQAVRAVVLALGDQPAITSSLVDQLFAEFETGKKPIVVPVHDNHRGHPMIISTDFRDEIMSRHDEAGLRGFLDAHETEVLRVPIENDAILSDIDNREDYRRELDKLKEYGR